MIQMLLQLDRDNININYLLEHTGHYKKPAEYFMMLIFTLTS